MSQRLIQTQEQKLVQQQKLTQQQMLQVKLLEMPIAELEQSVQAEIDDNPALETASTDNEEYDDESSPVDIEEDDENFEQRTEREERKDELDNVLQNMVGDDEMPEASGPSIGSYANADYEEITYGDRTSFYDKLKEQMGELDLNDQQREIMEYIVGSLDNDGLLRKKTDIIVDELAIYHNIYTSENEINEILEEIQEFDPAGIGARTLKECLLIQIERKQANPIRLMLRDIIDNHYDDFIGKRWDKIAHTMGISDDDMARIHEEVQRLNPKPGASMGEAEGRNMQQITPDFIVDTSDDGTITFSIKKGRVPELYVSDSFSDLVKMYQKDKGSLNTKEKEALIYAKEKIDRAQGFIEAIKQRRNTLYVTMRAIIDIQRKYFRDGDEGDLKPMILKDVADRTGLDISTVSRVSNRKYAQTRWGTFKLRHFFSDSIKTESGEELSTRKLKTMLREIIDGEDKRKPLGDEALSKEMKRRGFPIARRTVSKYREQMGIPVARLRKS